MKQFLVFLLILFALLISGCDDGPDGACVGRTAEGARACANESESDCEARANLGIGGSNWQFYPGDTCADHGIR